MKADTRGSRGIEMRIHVRRARPLRSTIMTRLTRFTDYYEIEALGDTYVVSFATAAHVERRLEECAVTDWIEFRDISG